MRALFKVLSVGMVVALFLTGCGSLGAPKPLRHVKVTFPAKDAHYAPYLIAIEKGYYTQEGIEVEIVDAAGSIGVDAVIAGDAEFTASGGTALTAILKGAPLKVIYSHMDRPNYEIWSSQASIQQLGDLKGKPVGIIGRGDSTEMSARMVLSQRGLDPNGVAYTALGPGAGRLAAVQSGAVAAAVLSITDVEQLKRNDPKGHQIVDIAQDVRMLFNGLATSDRLLKEDPELVAGFLRATLKGREYFKQFKDESLDIVGKYNNQPRELTEPVYRSIVPAMTADGTSPEDAQLADATMRAALVGATSVRPVGEIYDYSMTTRIVRELRQTWQPVR